MAKPRGKRRTTDAGAAVAAPVAAPAREPAPASVPASGPESAARPREGLAWWLATAPAMLAGALLFTFLVVALRRIRYPFALEWIEGGLLDEVRWLLSGHNLYVRPSVEFVPFIYNPLYFWVSAAAAKVLGASLFTMRLVSLASTLGTFGLLYALVVKETGSERAGVVGAGLYAATFKHAEQFMDLARVDALFVLLAVASVWALRTRTTAPGRTAAAVLLVLCFLAKQSGLFLAVSLVAFVLWDRRARGLPFALGVLGGIGGSVWLLDATSGGWYRFFAFDLPRSHGAVPWLWTDFWTVDLMGPLGCACLGALFLLFGPGSMARRERALWGAALLGVLLCSWASRVHNGGWGNVLMPAYAVLAAMFGVAFHTGMTLAEGAVPAVRRRLEVFLPLAATVQLAMLVYDPTHLAPTARDEAAGWRVVETLKAAPGDTFTPSDSYLAALAGKPPHLHAMAVMDVLRGPDATRMALAADIREALGKQRWSMLITDDGFFADDVLARYQRGPDAVSSPDDFYPVTGARYRPGSIFTPK